MKLRLDPSDEYLHELGPEPTFNESMYFNVYDAQSQLGAWFRIGNRANEGYAEMTVCLYLPDGRVGFMFKRPEITDNSAFDAGGMSITCDEPFERLSVNFSGRVVLLTDPLAMVDPRTAFAENPYDTAEIALTYTRISDMFGGEPEESHERPGEEFARGHYEQLVAGLGTIRVGVDTWTINGSGLRDHSWGPRTWQAPWYYRWLTCAAQPTPDRPAAEGWGFMGSRIARPEGEGSRGGFVWDSGTLHLCRDMRVSTEWTGDDFYHQRVSLDLTSGDRQWHATGRVLNLIPLRNRRDGRVTRISEGLTEWTLDDGRVGYGLSEYLDQILDDSPVGLAE